LKPFDNPSDAVAALAARLSPVDTETSPPAAGRVIAAPITADRDSPAADVSAMDGYAIAMSALELDRVSVMGEAQPGQPPASVSMDQAIRIFTGATIPQGAEAVVVREETDETSRDSVVWLDAARSTTAGANIRRRGENGKSGDIILEPGTLLTPASIAASASFGACQASLYRRVRVAIIVTGNELLDAAQQPTPWTYHRGRMQCAPVDRMSFANALHRRRPATQATIV
jgi:molybdopterin molybdotransferase